MTAPVSAELSPAGPKTQQRGIRLPQLLLSLLVVAVFALLAVWWQASTTSRTAVLALANNIEQGQPISAADLTEIYISTDVQANVSGAQFASSFVGTVPVSDFAAGTLITGEMFRRDSALLDGQAFVGLFLNPNEAPVGLAPGDRVQVLDQINGEMQILSPDALVESVLANGDEVQLRLRMDVNAAQDVQVRSQSVVVIEVNKGDPAPWEGGEDS